MASMAGRAVERTQSTAYRSPKNPEGLGQVRLRADREGGRRGGEEERHAVGEERVGTRRRLPPLLVFGPTRPPWADGVAGG